MENKLKRLNSFTIEQLRSLVIQLCGDGAEVQNCTIEEFAERYYSLDLFGQEE